MATSIGWNVQAKRCAIRGVLLAEVAPDWLLAHTPQECFERYSRRFDEYRTPSAQTQRLELAETMGADGHQWLAAVYEPTAPAWLAELPAVATVRRVWVQQYFVEEGRWSFRTNEHIPPPSLIIASPYESRCAFRRQGQPWLDWRHRCI